MKEGALQASGHVEESKDAAVSTIALTRADLRALADAAAASAPSALDSLDPLDAEEGLEGAEPGAGAEAEAAGGWKGARGEIGRAHV